MYLWVKYTSIQFTIACTKNQAPQSSWQHKTKPTAKYCRSWTLGAYLTCFGYVLFVTLAAHRAHEARTCGSTSFSSFQSIFLPVKTKQLLEKAETALCTLWYDHVGQLVLINSLLSSTVSCFLCQWQFKRTALELHQLYKGRHQSSGICFVASNSKARSIPASWHPKLAWTSASELNSCVTNKIE